MFLPHVSTSKTVLDSGFHVVSFRFQVLDSGFFVSELGFWNQIVSGIPDSLTVLRIPKPRIPTPQAKFSILRIAKKLPGFRNPDPLYGSGLQDWTTL